MVREANRIRGLLPTGEWIDLKPVKEDEMCDLALLEPEKVWSKGFSIPENVKLKVGNLVLTMDYPLDYMIASLS